MKRVNMKSHILEPSEIKSLGYLCEKAMRLEWGSLDEEKVRKIWDRLPEWVKLKAYQYGTQCGSVKDIIRDRVKNYGHFVEELYGSE